MLWPQHRASYLLVMHLVSSLHSWVIIECWFRFPYYIMCVKAYMYYCTVSWLICYLAFQFESFGFQCNEIPFFKIFLHLYSHLVNYCFVFFLLLWNLSLSLWWNLLSLASSRWSIKAQVILSSQSAIAVEQASKSTNRLRRLRDWAMKAKYVVFCFLGLSPWFFWITTLLEYQDRWKIGSKAQSKMGLNIGPTV